MVFCENFEYGDVHVMEIMGWYQNDKKRSIFLHRIICCRYLLELPR